MPYRYEFNKLMSNDSIIKLIINNGCRTVTPFTWSKTKNSCTRICPLIYYFISRYADFPS